MKSKDVSIICGVEEVWMGTEEIKVFFNIYKLDA